MQLRMFSIFDSKVQTFNSPWFMLTAGAALRAFADMRDDPNTMIHKHPGDYTLFEVGVFDQWTGEFVPHEALVNHGNAIARHAGEDEAELAIVAGGESQ